MQAKPERQTPINAGAYDSYNVMMKYIKKNQKKIPKRLHKSNNNKHTMRYYIITNYSAYELQNQNQNTTV